MIDNGEPDVIPEEDQESTQPDLTPHSDESPKNNE